MSFLIFDKDTRYLPLSEWLFTYGWIVVLIVSLSVAIFTPFWVSSQTAKAQWSNVELRKKETIFGVLYSLLIAWLGTALLVLHTGDSYIANTDEVKQAIQEEYGFELTDNGVEELYYSLFEFKGSNLYVVDVDGQMRPYTISHGEFHFLTEDEVAGLR